VTLAGEGLGEVTLPDVKGGSSLEDTWRIHPTQLKCRRRENGMLVMLGQGQLPPPPIPLPPTPTQLPTHPVRAIPLHSLPFQCTTAQAEPEELSFFMGQHTDREQDCVLSFS